MLRNKAIESLKSNWSIEYNTSVDTKPKGYYFETSFTNKIHLYFKQTNTMYSWSRVPSYVYGVLYGKLWISNEGKTEIMNHKTKEICLCKYYPAKSMFSKEPLNRVLCIVRDSNMMAKYVIEGVSSEQLDYSMVLNPIKITSIESDTLSKLNLSPGKLLWKQLEYRFKKNFKIMNFSLIFHILSIINIFGRVSLPINSSSHNYLISIPSLPYFLIVTHSYSYHYNHNH